MRRPRRPQKLQFHLDELQFITHVSLLINVDHLSVPTLQVPSATDLFRSHLHLALTFSQRPLHFAWGFPLAIFYTVVSGEFLLFLLSSWKILNNKSNQSATQSSASCCRRRYTRCKLLEPPFHDLILRLIITFFICIAYSFLEITYRRPSRS